ncbi:MAG TPA: sugar phosphate isomerase/epimerase [Candidatus Hydrogenedentes bacterium]|nr:sugar phosphate isomerase/epimerase [Candidatus Hydrogenedentota bacterium]
MMRIGMDDTALRANAGPLQAEDILRKASRLGAQGVHFSTVTSFSGRDEHAAKAVAQVAESLELYVEVGMGSCNPASMVRAPGDEQRDVREVMREMLHVAHWAGSNVLRTFVGWVEERRLDSPSWQEQLEQVAGILMEAAPLARELGVVICIENHMDITAHELRALVECAGSSTAGVCFDTANPLMLCEDPLEACQTLAPYIHCTHIKDAVLAGTMEEPKYVSAPLGQGLVPFDAILRTLVEASPCSTLSIEDHGGVFPTPRPRETDEALNEQLHANRGKLEIWLSQGNAILERNDFPVLQNTFDEIAQKAIAARCTQKLAALQAILNKFNGHR